MNKTSLLDRLEQMFWLSHDWDGFGTPPITKKVHDVGRDMIQMIEVNVDMSIFVGIEVEGSLYAEVYRPNVPKLCRIELTVLPSGNIEYADVREADVLSQGTFLLSYETINEILR